VLSLSRITASLYAKRTTQKDILVGRHEILCEPQHGSSCWILTRIDITQHAGCTVELDIILSRDGGHSTEPVTLFLKITDSPNASRSPTARLNAVNRTAIDLDSLPVIEGNAAPPTIQVKGETTQLAVVTPPLPPLSHTRDLPNESSISVRPASDSQAEIPGIAIRRAEEAIDTMETWGIAVGVVKQVMDAVGPIASVCPKQFCFFAELTSVLQLHPYASLAWSLLSKIPEVRHLALSEHAGHSFFFFSSLPDFVTAVSA
jgi:hypothetical protein